MKDFILIGAAGYIAPRHLQAIKDTNNNLIAAYDISDSVGILDSYFPHCDFFTDFKSFSQFVSQLEKKPDYLSICSPNFLHKDHIKWGLQNNINVICEKPLVLSISELNELHKYEKKSNAKVNSILQLRLHESIIKLKEEISQKEKNNKIDINLTYITSRGKWYLKSWKGDENKSGGLAMNIGVHFFDMLHFIFGEAIRIDVHYRDHLSISGEIEFSQAKVKWFLSIDEKVLPPNSVIGEKKTFRSIRFENKELEFSGGFTDLHTKSYENIILGNGFGLGCNEAALATVEKIRMSKISVRSEKIHHLVKRIQG